MHAECGALDSGSPDKQAPTAPATRPWRKGVVLLGEQAWAHGCVADRLSGDARYVLWVGERAPAGYTSVAPARIGRHLGSECQALVFDAHAGLHPDVLAAALGTLRAGGVLYLLLPAWDDWLGGDEAGLQRLACWPLDTAAVGRRFLRRLRRCIETDEVFLVVQQRQAGVLPKPVAGMPVSWTLSPEQERVAAAIERVAMGHARRPVVLTADRGRGKSTAVGAALARLLAAGRRVVLCAPGEPAVEAVFAQLLRELPQAERQADGFVFSGGSVRFRRPYEQLQDPQPCDLLMVDEAAAIGLGMLEALARTHNRLAFSTTVHGYEGSGRGFLLRFMQTLRRLMPQVHELALDEPVRWADGDPLERWLGDALLLAAEPRPAASPLAPGYRWLSQDELAADEDLLRQVFGLLVSAHYQTRPSDLQQLLDAPALRLLIAHQRGAVVGAALLVEEGGFDAALAAQVCLGRRRPRGHLLLQSLAQHAGWCDAPCLRALRVMRIAVQAGLRRQGVGRGLLLEAERYARAANMDLLGTAFGLDDAVLDFWLDAGYRVARVGYRVDPASGAHSGQMLKGLSTTGTELAEAAHRAFQRDLPLRLQGELCSLPAALVQTLLAGRPALDAVTPDERDRATLRAFAFGDRSYADARPALWRCVLAALGAGDRPDPILLRQVLQTPFAPDAAHAPDRALVRQLRAAAASLPGVQQ